MFRKTLVVAMLWMACLLTPAPVRAIDFTPEVLRGTPWPLTSRMRVELHVSDRRIGMTPESSGSFGGNAALAYGVARAARQVADRQVAPLREALGEFSLEQTLTQALERHLDRELFATEFDIVVVDLTQGQEFRYRDQKPGLRILEIHPFFGFNADGSAVAVSLAAQLQDRKAVDRRTRAFRLASLGSTYAFDDDAIDALKKADERMALWQQRLDRDLALKLLQQGADGAVEQLNDLLRRRRDASRDGAAKPMREGEANGRRWSVNSDDSYIRSIAPLPAQ